MAAKPVKVAFLADTADLRTNLAKAEQAMNGAADEANAAGKKIDRSFDGVAESSDQLATGSAQVAGGLGDLGGALALMPGPLGKMGGAMELLQAPIMGVTGAADLMNAATERFPVLSKVATAATKAQAVATRILGGAMRGLPIFAVIGLIALLVTAFVIAYKKSETFRNIVNKALSAVRKVAEKVASFFTEKVPKAFDKIIGAGKKVFSWSKKNWPLLLAILTGPFGLAVYAIAKNWGRIKEGATNTKKWVTDKFDALVGYVKNLPGRISRSASGMFGGIKEAFRSALNWIIDKWNGLSFTLPSIDTHIPGIGKVGGFTLSTPDIKRLATGGITTGPTLALVGDNPGGREAIVPLDKYSLGGNTYEITLQVPVGASSAEIGRTLVKHIDAFESAGGRRRAS